MSASLIFNLGGRGFAGVIGDWLKKRTALGSLDTARCRCGSIASVVWFVAG
jgi:hypothetical protein